MIDLPYLCTRKLREKRKLQYMNTGYLNIADFSLHLEGYRLLAAVQQLDGFPVFYSQEPLHEVVGSLCLAQEAIPAFDKVCYTSTAGGYLHQSGTCAQGFLYTGTDDEGHTLGIWKQETENKVFIQGDFHLYFFRFSLWLAFSLLTCRRDTVALHTSCVVWNGRAVTFLGESGTGKSTHTRLWCQHIPEAYLLNDDSPIVRVREGKVYVYGSPWSGKTPCYRQECHELAACVRLSQAPYNKIERLRVLQAYGALHPSCPPDLAYQPLLYKGVAQTLGLLLQHVSVYHLACLPNEEAARMSHREVFGMRETKK